MCEAYEGTTPADYENLTRDQIYVMLLPKATLKGLVGVQTMSVSSAIARGLIPNDREHFRGYRSLADKLNSEAKAAQQQSKSKTREQMRKQQAEAKASGG